MFEYNEGESTAFVGVSFSSKVIYNLVEREGEFEYTGRSVINLLKQDVNKFVSDIVLSQNYQYIDIILDDKMVFGKKFEEVNTNMESFNEIYRIMYEESNYIEYYYIYDLSEDLLIIKTPEIDDPIAVDYKNSKDIRNFINKLKYF